MLSAGSLLGPSVIAIVCSIVTKSLLLPDSRTADMAEYTTSFYKVGGYSVDEGTIAALWKQANEFLGKSDTEIETELEDSHTVKVKDIKEFFDDVFVKGHKIEQIAISGARYDSNPVRRFSIKLRTERTRNAISVELTGERQECTVRRAEIENIPKERALWYSVWIFSDLSYAITAALSCVAGGVAGVFIGKFDLPILELVSLCVAISIFVTFARLHLERPFFPQLIFEFGLSARSGVRAAYWRNVMGVGVILSLVTGVVASLIVAWLK